MQEDVTLQKFRRFKEMFISSSIPNSELLELIESYISPDSDNDAPEPTPVLDNQLSLFDIAA